MAESILVTGKKISSMELVTNVTGNEKIPTGQPDDLALTPNQIADHTISRGDLANQEDLSQVEADLGIQISELSNEVNTSNNSIRGLIAAEESARIAADSSLQTSLDGEVAARIAADNLKVDKEGSVSSVAGRVGDVVLAPSDVLVEGFGSQEDVNKYVPKTFLSGYTYGLGERVVLSSGEVVKSTVEDNVSNPNVDMNGWVTVSNQISVDSIQALVSLGSQNKIAQINVSSFYSGVKTKSRSVYYFDAQIEKSKANGGTVIDPTKLGGFDGTRSTIASFLNAQGTGTGNGCFVLSSDIVPTPYHFGAVGDGATNPNNNDTAALVAFFKSVMQGDVAEGTYLVEWNKLETSVQNQVMHGHGDASTIKLKGGTVIDQAGGVLTLKGSAATKLLGVDYRNFKIDGNKDNVTFSISPKDCEVLSGKYVEKSTIMQMHTVNGTHEGIDLDFCCDNTVAFNHSENNRGYGIHVSQGSCNNLILGNKTVNNGWDTFRGGMDGYNESGFEPASNNTYVGNYSADNYRNYNLNGPNSRASGNVSAGTPSVADAFSGVTGGFNPIGGDGTNSAFQFRSGSTNLSQVISVLNSAGNPRSRLQYDDVNDQFVVTDRFNNIRFTLANAGGGGGLPVSQTVTSATMEYLPETGAFSSITYSTRTASLIKTGRAVTLSMVIATSALTVGDASGSIRIGRLPEGYRPIGSVAVVLSNAAKWNFGTVPSCLSAVATPDGYIDLYINSPNEDSMKASVSALSTATGTFRNQLYISGTFILPT